MSAEENKPQLDVQQHFFVLPADVRVCFHRLECGRWERDGDRMKASVTMESHILRDGETCNKGGIPSL